MATGTRKRYNLTEGTLGAALGLGGAQAPFYDPSTFGHLTNNTTSTGSKGMKFTVDSSNMNANGGRVYTRAGVPMKIILYRVSDQVSLASKDITSEADTWVEAIFDTPVPLTQGSDYVISLHISGQSNSMYSDGDVTDDLTGGASSHLTFVEGLFGSYDTYPSSTLGNRVDGMIDVLAQEIAPVTTIDFGTDPGFDTLSAGEYVPLAIGNKEIVHLTDFTSEGTTGTVERAQEGTTAADHASGASWVHGPTTQDFDVRELVNWGTLEVEDVSTGTYTVVTDDTGKVKRCTVDCTVDLPTGLEVGTVVEIMAFSAGGTTVQSDGSSTVHNGGAVAQYDTVSCLVVATDTWVVTGVVS